MAERIPRPPKEKGYIQPKRVLGEKYDPKKHPRNVIIQSFRALPKSLTTLKITFHSDGKVSIPAYQEKKGMPDDIARKHLVELPNPYTAVRFSRHQIESISEEARGLDNIVRNVIAIHKEIADQWKGYNGSQKKSAMDFLNALAGALGNPNQLQSHYKLSAQERISRSTAFLEKGNDGAALSLLRGAANDLFRRKNQLTRQRVFLRRRHGLLLERTSIERERLEKYISDSIHRTARLRLPHLTAHEVQKVLGELRKEYQSLRSKREPELKQAAEYIVQAGKAIKLKRIKEAFEPLRQASRLLVHALARQYLLNAELLNFVSLSKDPKLRRSVFSLQLEMLADNALFWSQKGDRNRMSDHLLAFATVMQKDFPSSRTHLVKEASIAVRQGMGSVAEEKLLNALSEKQ